MLQGAQRLIAVLPKHGPGPDIAEQQGGGQVGDERQSDHAGQQGAVACREELAAETAMRGSHGIGRA